MDFFRGIKFLKNRSIMEVEKTGVFQTGKGQKPMKSPRQTSARWYDKYTHIRDLISLTENLPRSMQENIAEGLITSIKRYQSFSNRDSELRSLGTETVLALYKSHKKQRWYDTIPQMHKAMNLMIALPEPALIHLDQRCASLVAFMQSQRFSKTFNPAFLNVKVKNYLIGSEHFEIREQSSHLLSEKP